MADPRNLTDAELVEAYVQLRGTRVFGPNADHERQRLAEDTAAHRAELESRLAAARPAGDQGVWEQPRGTVLLSGEQFARCLAAVPDLLATPAPGGPGSEADHD